MIRFFILSLIFSCKSNENPKSNLETVINEGNQYARDGLYQEAITTYRKIIKTNPEYYAAHRTLGIVYIKTGNYKKAIKHLEFSIKKYQSEYEANFYLGEGYRSQSNYSDAIFRYQKALQAKNSDIKALKALSWTYYKIRFYSAALKIGRRLQKIAPNDIQVAIILARTYLKIDKAKHALSIIGRAKSKATSLQRPFLLSVEGDCLASLGKFSQAIAVYKMALKDEPLLAGSLLGLGKSLLKTGKNISTALSYIRRAVRIKPELAEGFFLLGRAAERGNPKMALRYYKKFLQLADADPNFRGEVKETKAKLLGFEKSLD